MPFRKRTSPILNGDRTDDTPENAAGVTDDDALALAEEAEAEAAEAEALAAAARARAKAIRLRRAAEAAALADAAEAEADPVTSPAEPAEAIAEAEAGEARADDPAVPQEWATSARARRRRPGWKAIGVGVSVVVLFALLSVSGYIIVHHNQVQAERQRSAEFAAAARQGVVSLMSLNYNTAKDDVARIIDNSTGQFKTDFETSAQDFTTVAEKSKVVTEATVNATAVKSMTDDSAVVLVSATSRITNAAGAKQDPRSWRLIVDVTRESDRVKMSKVEFVP